MGFQATDFKILDRLCGDRRRGTLHGTVLTTIKAAISSVGK
ncbi:MAG: hypothetical protein OJF51_004620 [Nitrospira sp.]|nr:MAG: hypothetical protein OJF51_004620 [Nitrospira sp.]